MRNLSEMQSAGDLLQRYYLTTHIVPIYGDYTEFSDGFKAGVALALKNVTEVIKSMHKGQHAGQKMMEENIIYNKAIQDVLQKIGVKDAKESS